MTDIGFGAALNPALVDPGLDSRAVNFENPTGARGSGGTAAGGRKGAPSRLVGAGERVVLADLEGPGALRHFWATVMPQPPEILRAFTLEFFYDGASEPSVSVPMLDFFGLPHGRPVAFESAMHCCQEGHGFNSYLPVPFRGGVRVEFTNASVRPAILYYQIDYTLEAALDERVGYLHATFRRENPTTLRQDFVIAEGTPGPGRFVGCSVGVRVLDGGAWYGEGEVKIYRDGDSEHPTICGTGLEDYVGSGWGMGQHSARFGGASLVLPAPAPGLGIGGLPDFVGFYRWHLPDPVMYRTDLTVTLQQIGFMIFLEGQEEAMAEYFRTNPPAGLGPTRKPAPGILAYGIAERVDDVCATAFVYATRPAPVPRVDVASAVADIGRRPYETVDPLERALQPDG
jgi:hypothetical protein